MAEISTARHRFVIADDHPLFRGALSTAIMGGFPGAEIAETGSIEELVAELERAPDTDLVLLDLTMPGVRGFSGLLLLRARIRAFPSSSFRRTTTRP